jgi:SM-20-related protein
MNAILATANIPDTPYLLDDIANDGFAIVDNFLPEDIITALAAEARKIQDTALLRPAGIGKYSDTQINHDIRGDSIHWLTADSQSAAQQIYLQQMENLRLSFNRDLYLSLFEMENHFSIYPAGAFYRKHLDQFHNSQQRQISCVLYLNHNWRLEDGGQLRLYLNDESALPYYDIEPVAGRLVLFLSGRFWHEVLPVMRERLSIAGWFKTRPDQPI